MRLPTALAALSCLLATGASAQPAPPAAPAAVPGEAVFVISGRGWGHGVGMSQFGAYGMARAGHTYDEILAHYYTGTTLGRAGRKEVRVLLSEGRRAVTISSSAPFTAVDRSRTVFRLPKGPLTLRANFVLRTADGPAEVVPPVVVRPARTAPLSVDGRLFRGKIEISVEDELLRAVNVLPLESYLQGVVAGEVPHTWPTEVLKAQAVAARSYALAGLLRGRPFDLYSDVRSQVYLGVAGEQERTTEAVRATVGEVVLYGGRVATTYYFSTSGGRTASAADVFGFASPYLVSRPDPWDRASPYHRWGPVLVGARTLQSKLELPGRVLDVSGTTSASGRLRTVTLQTVAGTTPVPPTLFRTSLGLRSTWVTIGALRLDRPQLPVVFGSSLELTGIARAVPSPMLVSSPNGASWSTVAPLERSAGGAVSLAVTPPRSLRYRIAVDGASSPSLLVPVAPQVELRQPPEPGVLAGTVRPRLPGAVVTIERRQGSAWSRVAEAIVRANGTFRAELRLVRGSYRARVGATDGFVEGVALPLAVTP